MNKWSAIACANLGGILILTMFLRLYGIEWGLPTSLHPDYSYHPDEAPLLVWSQWLSQGQLVAKQFIYGGTFYYVILRACIYFGDSFSEAIGGFNTLANAILAARYLQVFLALVTILLVYECGRLLYDRKSGLIAALVLALAPAHIVATQTVRPDAISAFLVALIALMAAKLLRSKSPDHRKLLVYSGIAIGAAAAFRLPLVGFGLMPVIAYVVARQRTSGDLFRKSLFSWDSLWLILAVVLAYVVLSPHTLMYPEAFITGIKVTASYETTVYPDAVDRGPIFFQYAWRLLHQALGYPGYFLALAGMIHALVRRRVEDMIVLAGIGLYFIMLASVSLTLVRYTLPILPLLALLSGVAVIRIFEQVRHDYARVFTYFVAGFLLAWTLAADLAFLHVTASKNARVQASEWITQNIPQGKSTLLVKQYDGDDFINPIMSPRHKNFAVLLADGGDSQRLFSEMKFDNVVLHELFYADMERLGSRHPRKEVWDFYAAMTGAGLKLVKEIRVPVQFLGIDFSGSFEAADFLVVNPAIRIYQVP
jgi:4-amino-4-deoxy-L-arabinose transferase-like glycosyltransferase